MGRDRCGVGQSLPPSLRGARPRLLSLIPDLSPGLGGGQDPGWLVPQPALNVAAKGD